MPQDIVSKIQNKEESVTVTISTLDDKYPPVLDDRGDSSGVSLLLRKERLCKHNNLNNPVSVETGGAFTIPDGYIGLVRPFSGPVKIIPEGLVENYPVDVSPSLAEDFTKGMEVAIVNLIKVANIKLQQND